MADDPSRKSEPEIVEPPPGAAPPSREPRHDPGVIEGEATEILESRRQPAARAGGPSRRSGGRGAGVRGAGSRAGGDPGAPEVRPRAPSSGFPFVAGALGALFGAALALGVAWFLDPRAAALSEATAHLAALDRAAEGQSQANANFDKRLVALEASAASGAKAAALEALGGRVAALEGAAGKDEAARAALEEARAARADAAKALALAAGTGQAAAPPVQGGAPAPFDASALEARIGALAGEIAGLKSRETDLGALDDRLAKIESALAAPKSEARVAAAEVAPIATGRPRRSSPFR